jgi:hypothetical protein
MQFYNTTPDKSGFSLRFNISFAFQRTTVTVFEGEPSPDLFPDLSGFEFCF